MDGFLVITEAADVLRLSFLPPLLLLSQVPEFNSEAKKRPSVNHQSIVELLSMPRALGQFNLNISACTVTEIRASTLMICIRVCGCKLQCVYLSVVHALLLPPCYLCMFVCTDSWLFGWKYDGSLRAASRQHTDRCRTGGRREPSADSLSQQPHTDIHASGCLSGSQDESGSPVCFSQTSHGKRREIK